MTARSTVLILVLLLGAVPSLASPPPPPEEALRAEMEERWDDAAAVYRSTLEAAPQRTDLWLRLADAEARRQDLTAVETALEGAIGSAPTDPSLRLRLARLHAQRGNTSAARGATARAIDLAPESTEAWRLSALYASWDGDVREAIRCWRELLDRLPDDPEGTLGLARALSWRGEIDDASNTYRDYFELGGDEPTARLEYARIECWRGAFHRALAALDEYRERYGEDPRWELERLDALARAGLPSQALEPIETRLAATSPEEPDRLRLSIAQALALSAAGRPVDSMNAVDRIAAAWPEDPQADEIERWLRTPHRPLVTPAWTFYSDSDNLERDALSARIEGSPRADVRLGLFGETADLSAPAGSGLETLAGEEEIEIRRLRLELRGRPTPSLELAGSVGRTEIREAETSDGLTSWGLGATLRLGDRGSLGLERRTDLLDISPRSAALGVRVDEHRLRLALDPNLRSHVEAWVGWDRLSDGNRRWEALLAPRWVAARQENVNLDLGLRAWGFGFEDDLRSGYFDPERFERYSVTLHAYVKLSAQVGFALFAAGGWERTIAPGIPDSFELGGEAAAKLTAGIFADWMLELSASGANNQRSTTGAFEAFSYRVGLTRRF